MKRTIAVKPIETLEFVFSDGTKREACFNVEALIHLTEEFGNIDTLFAKGISKPYDLAAKILYSGMKSFDSAVTLDEAKAIVVAMGFSFVIEVMDMFQENIGAVSDSELKKNLKPILNKMMIKQKMKMIRG